MGLSIHPSLVCDVCGVRNPSGSEWGTNTEGMDADVRAEAKLIGWRRVILRNWLGRRRRGDVCPDCLRKAKGGDS